MISIDGFLEGPNHSRDWHNVDGEFNEFAINQLNDTDTLLFGRKTYEGMAGYWSTDTAMRNDPVVATRMSDIRKFVFSTTLKQVN
jgi:dihydrofolate reductase